MTLPRRKFIRNALMGGLFLPAFAGSARRWQPGPETIMTTRGPVAADKLGKTLSHEHVLVDFIGAGETGYHRWDRKEVMRVVTPYLEAVRQAGFQSLVECTPAYLGRDPLLLQELSAKTGLHIITNTGYYGARNNKFLPPHALTESAAQLAARWTTEWEKGIDGTDIKPGFIKIGIDEGPLSAIHQKLVRAAAKTHLATGLTIASHTGTHAGAFETLDILADEGVSPEAFIWVHAQAEQDETRHIAAAKRGAWVSLDGVQDDTITSYAQTIIKLRSAGVLSNVLISQDAGWYSPGEKDGGSFRSYLSITNSLIPTLLKNGLHEDEITGLISRNPARAYGVQG